jgi:precorrin-6Y C5,15-methyltransferase (decarboxylating)
LLAARLGWRLEEVETLGLHAAQFALLRPVLARGVRVLATLRDGPAAGELAHWLTDQGLGATGMTVAEALGGPHERLRSVRAEAFDLKDVAAPVTVALDGTNLPQGAGLARVPGLADDSFAHDGQITKAPVRALTLSALAPRPGELLWDIGGGSGSISVEWCLAGGRALTVEKSAERVANIESNIKAFGLGARMEAIHGTAPQALKGAPLPDAVFIGGGGVDGLHGAIWDRLPPGTRLVANAVTLETEAALAALHAAHGGRLMRLELSEAVPLGRLTGWSAARPVVQWVVTKGASA